MESPQNHSVVVTSSSSPEFLSPGGKSRYGRTRRPKISHDFCNIDDVLMEETIETTPLRHSPLRSPKLKPPPKSPIEQKNVVFEITDDPKEFTELEDLEIKVANNFKANLQRGLDDSIKERKFFKSMFDSKTEVPNVVDVTKVLKLISSKPPVPEVCETKVTPKSVLKTYSNRRKHPHDTGGFIVESFGLPDEPIIPVNRSVRIERNNKIDIDVNCEASVGDVNLVNPWAFENYDPMPLYATEPVSTMEDNHFNRGGMMNMLPFDGLLSDSIQVEDVFDCKDNTDFEKSRIPTIAVPSTDCIKVDSKKNVGTQISNISVIKNNTSAKKIELKKLPERIDSKQSIREQSMNISHSEPEKEKSTTKDKSIKDGSILKNKSIISKTFKKLLEIEKISANQNVNKDSKLQGENFVQKKKFTPKKNEEETKDSNVTTRVLRKTEEIKNITATPVNKQPRTRDSDTDSTLQQDKKPTSNNTPKDRKISKRKLKNKQKNVSYPTRILRSSTGNKSIEHTEDPVPKLKEEDVINRDNPVPKLKEEHVITTDTVGLDEKNPENKKIIKKASKKGSVSPKKIQEFKSPTRVLRSSFNNSAEEIPQKPKSATTATDTSENKKTITKTVIVKKEPSHSGIDIISTPIKKEHVTPSNNFVINPVKLSKDVCSSQLRVILNPLSVLQTSDKKKNLVLNPFKGSKKQGQEKPKSAENSISKGITEAVIGSNSKAIKKTERVNLKKGPQQVKMENPNLNIPLDPIEYQPGDLLWAKIGTHPYWPCMVTQDPETGTFKKFFPKRSQPLYHVRFFGDKGRRSWVSEQYLMLYYAKDDLEKLAVALKAENKVKASYIREAYTVKGNKLGKWEIGVNEAESLKYRTVEERLNYFISILMKGLDVKKENSNDNIFQSEEGNSRKRNRVSEVTVNQKKIKLEANEIKIEVPIKSETSDIPVLLPVPEGLKRSRNGSLNNTKKDPLKHSFTESPQKKIKNSSEKLSPVKSPENRKKDESCRKQNTSQSPQKNFSQNKFRNNRRSDSEVTIDDVEPKDDANVTKVSGRSLSPEKRKKPIKSQNVLIKSPNASPQEDEALETRKKLRSSKIEPIEIIATKTEDVPRSSVEENVPTENEEKESKVLNKRHQIPGQNSNSDTDSKFSDNSSVPNSLKSQAAMYRRNNIFRGVPREKVCQICEQGGEVFKCKGPCNGVYHYKCAMNLIKKEEVREVKPKVEEIKNEGRVNEKKERNKVEIISVVSRTPLPSLSGSPNYKGLTLAEKIDLRMKEIMKNFDYQSVYAESTDSSSEEFILEESFEKVKTPTKLSLTVTKSPTKKEIPIIKHVTADNVSYICVTNNKSEKDYTELLEDSMKNQKCSWCMVGETPNCLVCHKDESTSGSKFRQKCSLHQCGRYYHPECLKTWPQTQWSLIHSTKDKESDAKYDTFVCPHHMCHTCISDDPHTANARCTSNKVVRCLRCPATYHSNNNCVPAATEILSASQIVCPRHFEKHNSRKRIQQTINANWCFICSKGGDLICCETCPTSVHVECIPDGDKEFNQDDIFFCEDCQSGRLPLYDEIVWVKLGTFRWWPALILFPNEVPDNVRNITHNRGDFVVKFFGTYDHYWVSRGRTFLFQEGDKGHSNSAKKRMDNAFVKAINEAAAAYELKKQFRLAMVAEKQNELKPPPYIRIKVNKPVGNVRLFDGNTSNTTSCDCDPSQPHPCGPDSDCLNRLLLTECNPEVCPAGERCNNQCFEKREYPPLTPYRTQARGWGLKTLAPIRKGQFVIEYVGEVIDEQEYQRRIQKMHEQKEENYYFLTIEKDRMLDAGPKGNVARFMNHSCQPNCETQKWTVNGDTRVGLFASCDIPADTELTFNYNLECVGEEKKICRCGAPNCSGFIGVKAKQESRKSRKPRKKRAVTPEVIIIESPCFICGKMGKVGACNNKICTKYYHLQCVDLTSWPDGGKWICPWHNCNMCEKRTIRCCSKCVNSYCPPHSQGYIRYDQSLGFVCFKHDPLEGNITLSNVPENKVNALKSEINTDDEDDIDSMSLSLRLKKYSTSTPLKKSNQPSSQDESEGSVVSSIVEKKSNKTKKKGKRRL